MKLFFFGDSICLGQGVTLSKSWVSKISSKLESYSRKIIVANPSINGRTSREALEDMYFQVLSHNPDILYIQFGMNDCNYWKTDKGIPRTNKQNFKSNLIEIIDRALKFNCKTIILSTNHPTLRNTKFRHFRSQSYQKSNNEYNKIIRTVSKIYKKKVILNDIEKFFEIEIKKRKTSLSKLLLKDKLHLSEEGHILYFKRNLKILLNAIKKMNS